MNTTVAVHLDLFSGDEAEFRLHLKSPGGSTVLNGGGDGDVLSEVGNSGTFTATVESLDGYFHALVTRNNAPVFEGWVDLRDDAGTYTINRGDLPRDLVEDLTATVEMPEGFLEDLSSAIGLTIIASPSVQLTGEHLQPMRGDRWVITLDTPADLDAATELWWTLKSDAEDTDQQAELQVSQSGGLLRLLGEPAADSSLATIVPDGTKATITIEAAATKQLASHDAFGHPIRYAWDLQRLADGAILTPAAGELTIIADVTRRIE